MLGSMLRRRHKSFERVCPTRELSKKVSIDVCEPDAAVKGARRQ